MNIATPVGLEMKPGTGWREDVSAVATLAMASAARAMTGRMFTMKSSKIKKNGKDSAKRLSEDFDLSCRHLIPLSNVT